MPPNLGNLNQRHGSDGGDGGKVKIYINKASKKRARKQWDLLDEFFKQLSFGG